MKTFTQHESLDLNIDFMNHSLLIKQNVLADVQSKTVNIVFFRFGFNNLLHAFKHFILLYGFSIPVYIKLLDKTKNSITKYLKSHRTKPKIWLKIKSFHTRTNIAGML